jgi:hypothetical protein
VMVPFEPGVLSFVTMVNIQQFTRPVPLPASRAECIKGATQRVISPRFRMFDSSELQKKEKKDDEMQ